MNKEPDLFSGALDAVGETRVLYLDTETTGADPETAHICEVAFLLSTYSGFNRRPEQDVQFQKLVKPPGRVPPEASAIHHITNEMLKDEPSIQDISGRIFELFRQADCISAHNLPYDLAILTRELPGVLQGMDSSSRLDSLRLSRHLWPLIPSHSLQALRYRFSLDSGITGEAHRAMFDTELVRSLVEYAIEQDIFNGNNWAELVEYVMSPLEVKVFSFGKYRGKLVEDIAAQDRDYIMWLLKQDWIPRDYPDLYHTILEKSSVDGRG